MLGDTALVVHPDDARYLHLLGKTAILPIMNREIPILADTMVDPKFGTGVVKVTPAHDPNDFEAAKRLKLPSIKVIGEDARMTAAAGPYAGLNREEARKRIVLALEESGELVKTEKYTVNLSKCERSKTVIEPLVSTQWFVHMKPLAQNAMAAVRSGRIRFVPDDREVLFFQWMENIRDWCISRQLWWGHRIPAWYCKPCGEMTVALEEPAVCPQCGSTELEQDSDVLDTWFSSGLWPFSTLGWPEKTEDLRAFYPTSLMITGFDILFFWVSRMIMLGIELTGEVPFREVHIHGLVRDADKQKMSKTKGNVIDPLVIMDRYGTDAVRIALLLSAAAGNDIALKEDRMESGRTFANKIWNASRLLFMYMERSGISAWTPGGAVALDTIEDHWIFYRLAHATELVNRALELHRYHEAAQTLWDFVWREFCDWYLEVKKLRFAENSGIDLHWQAALTVYEAALRLLHPLMPFVTEELWQRLIHGPGANAEQAKSISLAAYPTPAQSPSDAQQVHLFGLLQDVVTAARELRADNRVDPKATLEATVYLHAAQFAAVDLAAIGTIVKLNLEQRKGNLDSHAGLIRSASDFDLQIHAAAPPAAGDSRARILKEIESLEKLIENSDRQLNDQSFLSKAPQKVVSALTIKAADYREQLAKNKKLLENLG
jgi:valyl-tRNA synthetase